MKFETKLKKELMKFDISIIELQSFDNIFLFVSSKYAHLKQKYLRANNTDFIIKDMGKAIMKRSQLGSNLLKDKTES